MGGFVFFGGWRGRGLLSFFVLCLPGRLRSNQVGGVYFFSYLPLSFLPGASRRFLYPFVSGASVLRTRGEINLPGVLRYSE